MLGGIAIGITLVIVVISFLAIAGVAFNNQDQIKILMDSLEKMEKENDEMKMVILHLVAQKGEKNE